MLEPGNESVAERVAECGVGDDGRVVKEGRRTDALGAVDDLGGEGECARRNLFAQGADGGEGEDDAHAERLECGDVGTGGDAGGGDGVPGPVPCDKGDERAGGKGGDGDRCGREAPWLFC